MFHKTFADGIYGTLQIASIFKRRKNKFFEQKEMGCLREGALWFEGFRGYEFNAKFTPVLFNLGLEKQIWGFDFHPQAALHECFQNESRINTFPWLSGPDNLKRPPASPTHDRVGTFPTKG